MNKYKDNLLFYIKPDSDDCENWICIRDGAYIRKGINFTMNCIHGSLPKLYVLVTEPGYICLLYNNKEFIRTLDVDRRSFIDGLKSLKDDDELDEDLFNEVKDKLTDSELLYLECR